MPPRVSTGDRDAVLAWLGDAVTLLPAAAAAVEVAAAAVMMTQAAVTQGQVRQGWGMRLVWGMRDADLPVGL